MNQPTTLTTPHKRLIRIVNELELEHREEEQFGKYFIDVYLPEFHIGLEADGPRHLRNYDNKRDKELMKEHFLPVMRIKDVEMGTSSKRENVKTDIISFIEKWAETSRERLYQRQSLQQG